MAAILPRLDDLGDMLAVYDLVMAFVLLVVTQISTRFSGFSCEYSVRSLLRRIVYYVVIAVLCYRAYGLAKNQWQVNVPGAITNAVMILCIVTLGWMDLVWERKMRRRTGRRLRQASALEP
jgi:uncharacterized membrane protein